MRPLIITVLVSLSITSLAQITIESGSLTTHISTLISTMPSDTGNNYSPPSQIELNIWKRALNQLLDSNYVNAEIKLDSVNYDLVEFTDTVGVNNVYYVLRNNSSNYWGTYVYNPDFCRTTVIQAPHPQHDFNTGKQAIHVFMQSHSLFFCMSGTHRCNHSAFSSCDGTTSVCSGNSESFRISDMAHVSSTFFQEATALLFDKFGTSHFIQLHGFSKRSTDPCVIMSNGSPFTPTVDYLSLLQSELLVEDSSLTFKIAHIDTAWDRLRGFTNTQGRWINGSVDPCDDSPTTTSGRFLHIEQEKTKLRADVVGWNKMANAVVRTFVCSNLSSLEATPKKLTLYPNPTSGIVVVQGAQLTDAEWRIFNLHGKDCSLSAYAEPLGESLKLDISALGAGVYILQIGSENYRIVKQ